MVEGRDHRDFFPPGVLVDDFCIRIVQTQRSAFVVVGIPLVRRRVIPLVASLQFDGHIVFLVFFSDIQAGVDLDEMLFAGLHGLGWGGPGDDRFAHQTYLHAVLRETVAQAGDFLLVGYFLGTGSHVHGPAGCNAPGGGVGDRPFDEVVVVIEIVIPEVEMRQHPVSFVLGGQGGGQEREGQQDAPKQINPGSHIGRYLTGLRDGWQNRRRATTSRPGVHRGWVPG